MVARSSSGNMPQQRVGDFRRIPDPLRRRGQRIGAHGGGEQHAVAVDDIGARAQRRPRRGAAAPADRRRTPAARRGPPAAAAPRTRRAPESARGCARARLPADGFARRASGANTPAGPNGLTARALLRARRRQALVDRGFRQRRALAADDRRRDALRPAPRRGRGFRDARSRRAARADRASRVGDLVLQLAHVRLRSSPRRSWPCRGRSRARR